MKSTASHSSLITAANLAKYEADRPRCLVALRAGWSIGSINRQYRIPVPVLAAFRDQAGIPPKRVGGGDRKPMPEEGQVLE